jgi:hypothetical protein
MKNARICPKRGCISACLPGGPIPNDAVEVCVREPFSGVLLRLESFTAFRELVALNDAEPDGLAGRTDDAHVRKSCPEPFSKTLQRAKPGELCRLDLPCASCQPSYQILARRPISPSSAALTSIESLRLREP